MACVGPRNLVLDGVQIPHGKGAVLQVEVAWDQIKMNAKLDAITKVCVLRMWCFVTLLWILVESLVLNLLFPRHVPRREA